MDGNQGADGEQAGSSRGKRTMWP